MAPSKIDSDSPVEAFDKEALVQRNPHRDFGAVQASRPDYNPSDEWTLSKTPVPNWSAGQGASSLHWKDHKFTTIDPWESGRPTNLNYKLFVSTCVPRPIALVSTVSIDGTRNLAPISYWQNVCSDPPLYSLSLVGDEPNDTLKNILETGECCISMTSDWMIEAANFTSINTPRHISEWELAGLTPITSEAIKAPYPAESPFSAECKLHSTQDLHSRVDGHRTATLVLVEVVRFHIWEDALGKDRATADLKKLRPVFRAGGITYGTCFQGFELPRPEAFRIVREQEKVQSILDVAAKAAEQRKTETV